MVYAIAITGHTCGVLRRATGEGVGSSGKLARRRGASTDSRGTEME